jgi:predicted DNA-binding transcriptional regulator AlpA
MTYEFSIIASGLDPQAEEFDSRFYEAGCDDATVSFQKGHIILDFAREAENFETAVESAIRDVKRAGASVDRIEPDSLVSLSDIAKRSGLTRAAVHNYAKGERAAAFPTPVARITTDSALYDWAEVSEWLCARGTVSKEVYVQARIVRQLNASIDHSQQASGQKRRSDKQKQMV